MLTINNQIHDFTLKYALQQLVPLEKVLFLDIETTGFTAKNSILYLIGCSYYQEGNWYVRQWLATAYDQEPEILHAFFAFAENYTHLIHFNGNQFDLPFIQQKCRYYNLPYDFTKFEGIDIYKRITPLKSFLRLQNCKLKTIEKFLGITRTDTYNGGELISVYHNYVKAPNEESQNLFLLHNQDDIQGMMQILPILAYHDLIHKEVHAKKAQVNYYKDYNGNKCQELLISLVLPNALPVAVSSVLHGCYFSGEGTDASLKIPLYEEELKYFYANYKDYYYLPQEDLALHKSVATFVDKEHRVQASAATCYTRKFSLYLPQWELLVEPFFKRAYKSKELFFELTEDLKKDRDFFSKYAAHILDMMILSR